MIQEATRDIHLDPTDPDLLPLSELVKQLPARPSPPTLHRWTYKGIRGTRLRTVKVCGRHFSTEAALKEFIMAIQNTPSPTGPTDEELDAVDRQLKAKGYA